MVIVDKINNFFRALCTFLLILMTFLVIFQVVSRKFLMISVAEVEELSRYCMIWTALIGAAIGISTKSHVAVEVLRDTFPPRLKRVITIFSYVIIAAFFLILLVFGFKLSNQAMSQVSPSMPFLKMGFIMLSVPLTGVLGLINLFALTAVDLRKYPGGLAVNSASEERS